MGYRILLVNWRDIRHPEAGGAEVHLHEIFRRIAAAGQQVVLLTSRYPGARDSDEIDGVHILRRGGKYTFNLVVPWVYKRELAHQEFDVIVEDLNKIPFYLPLFSARPVLALVPHLFGRTIFAETHPLPAGYIYLAEKAISSVYRRCQFEVISESTKQDLVDRGISPEQIQVVYCGLDHSRYGPGKESFRPAGRVVYVGRLKRYKRVDVLIQAMALVQKAVPQAHLTIIGQGDQEAFLRGLTGQLNLTSKVTFLGHVAEETKIHLLQRADVTVFPSAKEGWGLTAIEANACGSPVVASNVAGLRDSVVEGSTGFLVDYGDVEGFAARIIQLLTDAKLRACLSRQALAWARRFDWGVAARQTLHIIEGVVAAGPVQNALSPMANKKTTPRRIHAEIDP